MLTGPPPKFNGTRDIVTRGLAIRWDQSPFGVTRTDPVLMAKAWDEPDSTPDVEPATTCPHRSGQLQNLASSRLLR